mmetsp:Transcript_111399/g.208969  ORF Transcript_111399/g.208969 Transcript_111399/m.208969 type:complete len:90 (-) Transcript_111399:1216-1485(-)
MQVKTLKRSLHETHRSGLGWQQHRFVPAATPCKSIRFRVYFQVRFQLFQGLHRRKSHLHYGCNAQLNFCQSAEQHFVLPAAFLMLSIGR